MWQIAGDEVLFNSHIEKYGPKKLRNEDLRLLQETKEKWQERDKTQAMTMETLTNLLGF